MVQVIIFFIAFGVLVAKGVGVIGAFLGGLGIAIVAGFIFMIAVAALGNR